MSAERWRPPEGERENDLEWINENLHVLYPAALLGHEALGRGALVVDTLTVIIQENQIGNPMYYLPLKDIVKRRDRDTLRMVRAYDPVREFVTVLLKENDKESVYRIFIPGRPSKN